jgi:hypothetical protein
LQRTAVETAAGGGYRLGNAKKLDLPSRLGRPASNKARSAGEGVMTRYVYHNIQKCMNNAGKLPVVTESLRNFWFSPDFYLLSEVNTTCTYEVLEEFARDLFKVNIFGGSAIQWMNTSVYRGVDNVNRAISAGARVSLIEPTATSPNTSEPLTEKFALIAKEGWGQAVRRDPSALADFLPVALKERETRSGFGEEMFATRFLGRFNAGSNITGYLCHPSPTGANNFFKHLVRALTQEHQDGKFFVMGDFNIEPDSRVERGVTAAEYAAARGCKVCPPEQDTHKEGKIDWVLLGSALTNKLNTCQVLPHEGPIKSDHRPIYFDLK